jgi:hypothetical protein
MRKKSFHSATDLVNGWDHRGEDLFGVGPVLAKIQNRFTVSSGTKQTPSPTFIHSAQLSTCHAQRLSPLRVGLCFEQICQSLCLGKVEFSIMKRSSCELTRFSVTHH